MSRLITYISAVLFLSALPSNVYAMPPLLEHHHVIGGVVMTIIYSVLGMALAALAYRLIDALTPGNLGKELTEKQNIALAIVAGSMILGVCIIIAAAMVG